MRTRAETFVKDVVERGPLDTAYRFVQEDLHGALVFGSFGSSWATGRWRVWLAAVMAPPLVGLAMLLLADAVLQESPLGWQIAYVAVMALLALAFGVLLYLIALRRTRRFVMGRVARWSWEDRLLWAVALAVLPAAGFAVATAFLAHHRILRVSGVASSDPQLAFYTAEAYLWSLAQAVPVLQLTETFHWTSQLVFRSSGGEALVLAYKLLFLLPLVQIAAIVIGRSFGEDSGSAADMEKDGTSTA